MYMSMVASRSRPQIPQSRSAACRSGVAVIAPGLESISAFPGTAVPADHPLEETHHILGEDAEEGLPLLGGGLARVADMTVDTPLPGDPAPGRRLEGRAGRDRLDRAEIADEARRQVQDHRGLPFAGVGHPLLRDRGVRLVRLTTQEPVGRRQEQQVVALPIALAGLEDRLLAGH